MNVMRLTANCRSTLLSAMPLGLCLVAGCGGGGSSTGSTTLPATGAVTPMVTVTPSAAGSISTTQALSVTVGVTSSSGTPAGSVVLSSGSYASFPMNLSGGQATISVPAGLLAVGTDALTVKFTPASAAAYNSASGTANVTVVASGAAAPVVTASSVMYSTAGYGYPFRALPLASGNVLVSVSAATSGMVVFGPTTGGGLQFSCFNYVRPAFAADGASDFGMNLLPNGLGLAATLGVDGVIFYNLSTLQTCNSTGLQVSQGPVSANEGSFDVAVSPDGKYAFVANEYGVAAGATAQGNIGVVAVPASASVAQTVATGLFPREITVGSDDATLFLTNYSSQSFQVISTIVH